METLEQVRVLSKISEGSDVINSYRFDRFVGLRNIISKNLGDLDDQRVFDFLFHKYGFPTHLLDDKFLYKYAFTIGDIVVIVNATVEREVFFEVGVEMDAANHLLTRWKIGNGDIRLNSKITHGSINYKKDTPELVEDIDRFIAEMRSPIMLRGFKTDIIGKRVRLNISR